MVKSRLLILLGLFGSALLGVSLSAATLTGRVYDKETGKVLSAATVSVLELERATMTDKYGVFELKQVEPGTYTVVVSHVSYDHSDSIQIAAPATNPVSINLTPKPWVLNDVVVTATRSPHLLKNVPVQTEVVNERDFQRTGATTVDEALSSSIGINIDEDQAGQGATIRGVGGDRVLVLIDGERTVGRVKGNIDLSQIALTNVKKIEVVKGTGSTLYGSDAMGGVINIITKDPDRDTRQLSAYVDGGTHNTYNPSIAYDYGSPKIGFTLGGKYYATDGFDLIKETPHTNGQDAIKRLNLNSKVRYELAEGWSLTPAARYMYEERNWTEAEVLPFVGEELYIVNDDREDNNRYEGSLTLKHLSGDKYSMSFRAFGTYYDHDFEKVSTETGQTTDASRTEDRYFDLSYNANYMIGDGHMATFGGEFNYQDLTSSELLDGKQLNRSGAAYLQYEYEPIRNLTLLPGVRYETHDAFGNHLNPSFNAMYSLTETIKLRGFVGYGFRAPSIKQQYFIFDHSAAGYIVYGGSIPIPDEATNSFAGNFEALKEETSLNSSVSVEFSYGSIGLHRLTYFYNHLDDLIEFSLLGFPTIDGVDYWRGAYAYLNVEQALTQGIEWESRVRLSDNVDFSFSYNYLDARNLKDGSELINRPPHSFKFFITGYAERLSSGVTFWGNYHSRKLWVPRSNTGGNEGEPLEAPSRTTLNLNFFTNITPQLESFVRLENLLDQVEVDYGYWPGFQIFAGFKYDLALHKQQ